VRVIDSSSLAKLINREENWERVEIVLREGCVSLDLAMIETENSLWVRVRRGLLEPRRAQTILHEFVSSRPFELRGQEKFYESAFRIAITSGLTVYDALFLALSKEENATLVTSDHDQSEAASKLGLQVLYIP